MMNVIDLDEKRKKEQRSDSPTKDEKIKAIYNTIDILIEMLDDLKSDLTEVLNE